MSTTTTSIPDRTQWRAARTLPALAELTAHWLEGTLGFQPGYDESGCGPDEETTKLVPTLALLNRAGWLTDCSQPGYIVGVDEQRAACTGFLDWHLANQVARIADNADLITIVTSVDQRWWVRHDHSPGIAVSREFGKPTTMFGRRPHRRDVALRYRGCHPAAKAAVAAATNLTVIDPVWGRNDVLWPMLRKAVSP